MNKKIKHTSLTPLPDKAVNLSEELQAQISLLNGMNLRKADITSIVFQGKIIMKTVEELLTAICGGDAWHTGIEKPKRTDNESTDVI